MPLARDQERVARLQTIHRAQDRLGAVADLGGLGAALQNRRPDRGGVLGPRVVVGHDHDIGFRRGGPAHQRPFAPIPVPARAEDDMQAAKDMGAQRPERRFQRVGRMRVIDIDRRAVVADPRASCMRAAHACEVPQHAEKTASGSSPAAMARPAAVITFIA